MKDREYTLNEIVIDPRDLVLDPNNPRILDGLPQKQFTEEEIVSNSTQSFLRNKLREKEHGVQKLIESMTNNGFVNIDSIFVKKLKSSRKYLVLEGNRRTTAINHLLDNASSVSDFALQSLKKIPAKELICENAKTHEEMTAFILSIRHLGGVKNWTPMQQASTIYEFYMREFTARNKHLTFLYKNGVEFKYDPDIAEYVSSTLNLSKKEVIKSLRIYVVYNQLKTLDYPVESEHYSLIDLATNAYPLLRDEFFEVRDKTFIMSYDGLDYFNSLCLEKGCKITNPKIFRDFYHVFKNGTKNDLRVAVHGDDDISEVKKRIVNKTNFYKQLEDIRKKLGSLVITDYRSTVKEKKLILEIKKLVDKKLIKLAK